MMEVATALGGLNIAVLAALLYVYGRIALKSRSATSFGLIVFGSLLLAHNLLTVYAYVTMAPLFGTEALPYLSGIAVLELGAVLVLLRMTL
ncbi:MAG: hypothetical protein HYW93_01135 [Thaumarchaeota archaeon]|nr:hypothetical protein [Nitrososphaerota archaeon]